MKRHIDAIRRLKIDYQYAYRPDDLLVEKISFMARSCQRVLDIGQSSRVMASLFDQDKLETTNISANPAPDIIDDICAPTRLQGNRYDGIVCLSVLEHVYDPFAAINEIHNLLKPGGYLLLHLPFMFRYHAPLISLSPTAIVSLETVLRGC